MNATHTDDWSFQQVPVSATTLEMLMAAGLHGEGLLAVVKSIEADNVPKRSKAAERQARYAAKKKASANDVSSDASAVTPNDAKSFPDKEIPHTPLENNPSKNPVSKKIPARAQDADEIEEAVEAWNALAHDLGFAKVQRLTEARKASLRLRLSESGGIQGWHVAMGKIRGSPFLRGEGRGGWRADFDFVLQAKSFTKLMEGGYDDKGRKSASSGGERFLDRLIADAESDSSWP